MGEIRTPGVTYWNLGTTNCWKWPCLKIQFFPASLNPGAVGVLSLLGEEIGKVLQVSAQLKSK